MAWLSGLNGELGKVNWGMKFEGGKEGRKEGAEATKYICSMLKAYTLCVRFISVSECVALVRIYFAVSFIPQLDLAWQKQNSANDLWTLFHSWLFPSMFDFVTNTSFWVSSLISKPRTRMQPEASGGKWIEGKQIMKAGSYLSRLKFDPFVCMSWQLTHIHRGQSLWHDAEREWHSVPVVMQHEPVACVYEKDIVWFNHCNTGSVTF